MTMLRFVPVAALLCLHSCSSGTSHADDETSLKPEVETTPSSAHWSTVTFKSQGGGVSTAFDFGDNVSLPTGDVGLPLKGDPAVVMNVSGLYVDGEEVFPLRRGMPEVSWDEAESAVSAALADVKQGDEATNPIAIFADRRLPARSLGLVIRAVDNAARGFQLVVQGSDGVARGLAFDRPQINADGEIDIGPGGGALALDVSGFSSVRVGVRAANGNDGPGWLERRPLDTAKSDDLRRFEALVRGFAEQFGGSKASRRALIAVDGDASVQRVASVLSAVNGPDCSEVSVRRTAS